jgi:anti-anti-sigma factor
MIRTDSVRGEVWVTPPSEIDIVSGDNLTESIARACDLGPDVVVVVDFAGVTFCDSTATKVLVHALRRLHDHGCSMDIRNPSRSLRQIATILGDADVLNIPMLLWPDP